MLHIILVNAQRKNFHSFAEGLSSDPEVCLEQVSSGAEALSIVRNKSPQLVIVDSGSPDIEPLDLIREIISANAMVNTAVVSALSDHEFHEEARALESCAGSPSTPARVRLTNC